MVSIISVDPAEIYAFMFEIVFLQFDGRHCSSSLLPTRCVWYESTSCQRVQTKARVIRSSWAASCFCLCLNRAMVVFVISMCNYISSAPPCKCKCFGRDYEMWRHSLQTADDPGGGGEGRVCVRGVSFHLGCAQHMCMKEWRCEAAETDRTDHRWTPFRETWQQTRRGKIRKGHHEATQPAQVMLVQLEPTERGQKH